jgi:hypothetical protein
MFANFATHDGSLKLTVPLLRLASTDAQVGNLVFLSARPHVYKDWSERGQYAHFMELSVAAPDRQRMHTVPTLLPGDLSSGFEFIQKGDFRPLAQKKFESFKQFASLYPEFRHVFVGDNGQVRSGLWEHLFASFRANITWR